MATFPNVADRGTYPQHRIDQVEVARQPEPPASEVIQTGQESFAAERRSDRDRTYRIDTPEDASARRTPPSQPSSIRIKPQHLLAAVLVLFAVALGIMVVRGRDQPAQVVPRVWPSPNDGASHETFADRSAATPPRQTETRNRPNRKKLGARKLMNERQSAGKRSKSAAADYTPTATTQAEPAAVAGEPGVARLNGTIGSADLRAEHLSDQQERY